MTSRPRPSAQTIVPAVLAVAVLVIAVIVGANVLATAEPTPSPSVAPSPTPAITITPTQVPTPTEAPTPTDPPTPTPAPIPSATPAITTATLNRTDPAGNWVIRYRYPKLVAGTSPMAAQINSLIFQYIDTRAAEFAAGPAAVPPPPGGHANSLEATFSTALVTPGLLSLRFKEVEDMNGVHPATKIAAETFDLATGQTLGFGDIFADPPAALSIMSTKARAQLRASVGPSDQLDSGTTPDAQNFETWAVTKAGLEVTFQEYQVAPSAYGTPVVVIAWKDLQPVLNVDSPVAALAGG